MTVEKLDIVTMGRSSIDLYSNDIGAPFTEIKSFAAFVGGCPTNIAVGAARLGLKSALLTAVGEDPVGEFVLNFLRNENVETAFIPRKRGTRTSAVVLGIEPPDKFPLVYYRDNCADIQLTVEDVDAIPFQNCRALLVSGTGLSRDPSRTATLHAIERARLAGTKVILDLDFRADQWLSSPAADVRAFGLTVRSILPSVDLVFGTEEEIKAATLANAAQVKISHSQISAPEVSGDLNSGIETILNSGIVALVVKRGAEGASVHTRDGVFRGAPFKVEVANVLGAGDAFASGFIYAYLKGWEWAKCARMGNATGAIVVTKQGCANFMPTEREALAFVESQGGFLEEEKVSPKFL